jgi:hypothetical protein
MSPTMPTTVTSYQVMVQRHDSHPHAGSELGVLLVECHGHAVHLIVRLLDGHTRLQPRDRQPVVVPVAAAHFVVAGECDRPVDLGRKLDADGIGKLPRHHTDNLERLIVHFDALADHLRAAAKPPLPVAVAQDRDAVPAVDLVLGRERAPEHRCNTKHLEELVRDAQPSAIDWLASLVTHPQDAVTAGAGDRLERLLHPPPVEIRLRRRLSTPERGGPPRIVLEHRHQPIVLVERQPAQDDRIDDGEDGGAGADAKREDSEGDSREVGREAQRTDAFRESSRMGG